MPTTPKKVRLHNAAEASSTSSQKRRFEDIQNNISFQAKQVKMDEEKVDKRSNFSVPTNGFNKPGSSSAGATKKLVIKNFKCKLLVLYCKLSNNCKIMLE